MKRFTYDFSGFVLGAALCSVPICMTIDSYVTLERTSAKVSALPAESARMGSGGVLHILSRARAAQVHRRDAPPTGESLGQSKTGLTPEKDPGPADYRPVSIRMERSADPGHFVSPFVRVGVAAYQAPGSVDGSLQGASSDGGMGVGTLDPLSERWPPSNNAGSGEPDEKRMRSSSSLRVSLLREIKHDMADAAARLCGVPTGLFRALIARESSWRWQTSHKGAVGLTQVMPIVARTFPSLDVNTGWGNLLAGACWLRMEFDTYGRGLPEFQAWERAVYSYHAGRGRVLSVSASYVEDIMTGGGM